MIALAGMIVVHLSVLTAMALAAAVAVLFTVLTAITLLPALLGLLGPKVLSNKQRAVLGTSDTVPRTPHSARWSTGLKHPVPAMLAVLAVLAVLVTLVGGFPRTSEKPTPAPTRRARPAGSTTR